MKSQTAHLKKIRPSVNENPADNEKAMSRTSTVVRNMESLENRDTRLYGVEKATLTGFTAAGIPTIDFPENPFNWSIEAESVVDVSTTDIGRQITICFEKGDPQRPIISGLIRECPMQEASTETSLSVLEEYIDVAMDGDTMVVTLKRDIIIRRGEASIHLNRGGKVVLRGSDILSCSSGPNMVKGASVDIN